MEIGLHYVPIIMTLIYHTNSADSDHVDFVFSNESLIQPNIELQENGEHIGYLCYDDQEHFVAGDDQETS